ALALAKVLALRLYRAPMFCGLAGVWKIQYYLDMYIKAPLALGLTLALHAAPPPEKFDSYVVSEVMVPMRDGVKLATDFYRPARDHQVVEGKFPVLLYRTPYNKAGQKGAAAYFTQHGYIVAVQDCRGRFASQGEFYAFVNEGKDGYDAIEWAGTQTWSNGSVGTIGGS